ncbi:MAG TPA: hypothetical protein DD435_12770 [Cyanobacteria bacterium UBA8530]|nr:hypothetical protein [Cyanobacteria bacterium UBA8530]
MLLKGLRFSAKDEEGTLKEEAEIAAGSSVDSMQFSIFSRQNQEAVQATNPIAAGIQNFLNEQENQSLK